MALSFLWPSSHVLLNRPTFAGGIIDANRQRWHDGARRPSASMSLSLRRANMCAEEITSLVGAHQAGAVSKPSGGGAECSIHNHQAFCTPRYHRRRQNEAAARRYEHQLQQIERRQTSYWHFQRDKASSRVAQAKAPSNFEGKAARRRFHRNLSGMLKEAGNRNGIFLASSAKQERSENVRLGRRSPNSIESLLCVAGIERRPRRGPASAHEVICGVAWHRSVSWPASFRPA